ncbi:probable cinnamyl alcohol dehydrogenase 5 [Camellia sinensis]|uniref:probable cinnamyl alcohol dehydrogenase 5 n=1 Tax=Camellia sinensis TaxID=4442 RepID=UPI0010369FA9|nr:probable cinnamyl alcohol dehydrogenase 5 [Camellia sinensis]
MDNYCSKGPVGTINHLDVDGTITKGGHSSHIVVHERIAFLRTPGTPIALLLATNRSSPRTPSKNRGKTITATQQQLVHKCQLGSDNKKPFLQLVIAEMDIGNRQPCGLSMTRTKPLEHLDLMEQVYSSAAAIGKHAWTPTELRNDDADAANANGDSGIGPLSASTPLHPVHDTISENVVDSSLFDNAPPQLAADRSANAKRRE